MLRKLTTISAFVLVLVLGLTLTPASANHKSNSDQSRIPEKNGVYDDPDHPGVKVRVFVHGEKPQQTTSSLLVCGLADPDSQVAVHSAGWHLPSNVTYNLNPSSVPSSVGSTNLATMADNGFDEWSAATGSKVNFTRGSDTTLYRAAYDGKNIIAWGRTSGSSLGVTYVWYYSFSGLVVDVDTIMNKRVSWKWANSATCADSAYYDAENILEHEQGHWLGLDDEYSTTYENHTMFGYGKKGEVKKNTLTTGDKTGSASIYQ